MNKKERKLKHLQHCKNLAKAKFENEKKKQEQQRMRCSFVEMFPSHNVKASGVFNSIFAKY